MKKDLCQVKSCTNFGRYARFCGHFAATAPKAPAINKKSTNQKEIDKEYRALRVQFLIDNPLCQAKLEGCKKVANEIHHTQGKATRELYLDTSKMLPVCYHCHRIIEDNPAFAKQKGLSVSRLK